FRTQLYQLLKEGPFEVNFNQELFVDELKHFINYKKQDYQDFCKDGELVLQPNAVLGLFPQAGSYLVPDYEELIKMPDIPDLEEFFLSKVISGDTADS